MRDIMDERDFARFQLKIDSDRLGYIDTGSRIIVGDKGKIIQKHGNKE